MCLETLCFLRYVSDCDVNHHIQPVSTGVLLHAEQHRTKRIISNKPTNVIHITYQFDWSMPHACTAK